MQNDDNGMTGQQEGATAAPATGGKGFGKGLLDLAKASAKEAGRGAKLAALKTQMEKLKRMDLVNALAALGAKTHETNSLAETFGPQYAEIDGLDEDIKTKRVGVEAKDDDGFAGKAKAKAISVKMGAEAQALEHKRKNKCVEIGRAIVDGGSGVEGLAAEIPAIADIQRRIDELDQQLGAVADDRTGRDALASSARSLGADAKAASKSPVWKKPAVWIGITAVLAVSAAVVFFKGGGSGTSGAESAQASNQARQVEGSAGTRGGSGEAKNLIAGWGVTLKELEKIENYNRYTSVQRSTAFKELWDRALVLEHKPNVRVLFMKFPNGFKYKVVNVTDYSTRGTPCLEIDLTPADDASQEKIAEAENKIHEATGFSMAMGSPRLVALLSDKQMQNLNRDEEIRSDDWTLAVALNDQGSLNADIVFRKDSEYVTILAMLGSSL